MKTDDLIDALAAGLQPARPARLNPWLLAAAAAASVAAVAILLGVRPTLTEALSSPTLFLKGLYTGALAGAALWLGLRAGRPGADTRGPLVMLLGVVIIAILWGVIELAAAPADQRMAVWLGDTWRVCVPNILMVAAVAAIPVFLAGRSLAPTRPSAAGFAFGAATGAIAATAYGVLHCPESTAAFVATWYTLGITAAGLVGAAAGRFALRW
ncbi:DUF1109 domain-containing protein [uncultured Brevundimonas sp.]|uniref:DUF1109 domain-containing protein n=1 Tax=uncultured Brevundimonas sp. TaxID=213418 RepID=UPI0026240118|nr:DUF1109 domain-containing protein [uncultured Brevundimonas sp.]